jgi:hypothetical protein
LAQALPGGGFHRVAAFIKWRFHQVALSSSGAFIKSWTKLALHLPVEACGGLPAGWGWTA